MKCLLLILLSVAGPLTTSHAYAVPAVYRDQVEPHWSTDKTSFWYRVTTGEQTHEYIFVDCAKAIRKPAFDHEKVAAALSEKMGRHATAEKLPIETLDFDAEPGAVVMRVGGKMWRLNIADGAFTLADRPVRISSPVAILRPKPSRLGSATTDIAFENQTHGAITIFWIDDKGKRKSYGQVKPGERWNSQTYVGHVWELVDREGKTVGIYEAGIDPTTAVVKDSSPARPASPESPTTRANTKADAAAAQSPQLSRRANRMPRGPVSPDGQWIASIKNQNIAIGPKTGGEPTQLSDDGKPGDDYAIDRIWWSPDSKHLFALKTEAGQEHKIYTIESSPGDQLQPKLRTLDYLKPGDKIDYPRPRLFDVATHKSIPVNENLCPNPWSIQEVRWAADSSRVTFVYNQRGHQSLRLLAIAADTGEVTALVDEHSDTFIDYSGKYFAYRAGDDELIWMSERDGWNHLWLYDLKNGKVKNQITHGQWVVQAVTFVDETRRQIWFKAGGVRPGQDPYYTHFCRVNFDGSGLTVLTEGDGTHKTRWEPGDKYMIDSWSRVDQPPVTELRECESGRIVCKLEEADAHEVLATQGGRWTERFVAKGRDGATDIYGTIVLPRDFDPARKYPVVENIYAGPQGFFTQKGFRARGGVQQQIADRGIIVVQCDGMGTNGRSKAFHDVCCKNLRDAGFPDRIAWIKAAAEKFSQMDLSRVGIYGGSAGGQNAMAALLWHHDFYKVAVADCGCHDNRMDKIWWNEQWMGWPVGPEYAANSNAVNANLLEGKLMLIFGELDDNVDPSSTMQVVNQLEKADKDFELVIVTGAHHGAAETPYGSKRRMEFLTRNLLGNPHP